MDSSASDFRVLFISPTEKDARVARSVLDRAGVVSVRCGDLSAVCAELEHGAGTILVPEEAIHPAARQELVQWLARQPPWSDLPVLIMARSGADSTLLVQATDLLGNVAVLERPIRVAALVSTVRSALRARRRQYETREHLERLQRAEVALREANQRKDEFLAMLAHELRNPLAPIRNSLYILRLTGTKDSTTSHVREMMERQLTHMTRLVDDLMEVSRITQGKIELMRTLVEVAPILHDAVEMSRPMIEGAHHQFNTSIPARSLIVEGDRVRLTQAIANLLNNAAKYTDDGGDISLALRAEGDEAVITVKDNGTGIPSDKLEEIFELFSQVGHSPDRTQSGLGIGLTLVKRLAEMHGGSIEARSEGPGKGSEFTLRLPLAKVSRHPVEVTAEDKNTEPLKPRRILVVDDNRDSAESLAMLLGILGAEVHIAYSGEMALRMLDAIQPDALLLDIGMPGMDGYEVARRVRADASRRDIILIALTGWGQEEDRKRSEGAGFDYHLIKPANVRGLETLFRTLETRVEQQPNEPRH